MRPNCSDGPALRRGRADDPLSRRAVPVAGRVASAHDRCLAAVRSQRSSWRPRRERTPPRCRRRTLVTTPGSEAACEEVRELVAAALGEELDDAGHPLEVAARRIHEDLVVMERRNGAWVMTAGVVCFPTRWRPSEKIGRTMAAIHEPVPRYDDIATAVDRFSTVSNRAAWRGGRIGRWSATQRCGLRPTIAKPLDRFPPIPTVTCCCESSDRPCGASNAPRMRSCSPSAFIGGHSVRCSERSIRR